MRTQGIHTNLQVDSIDDVRDFYTGFLGLRDEEMNLGWVARFTDPDTGLNVQVVTRDATAAEDSVATIKVDDVEAAYADAQRRGYQIVHELRTEEWGVRRFFVRDPSGNVLNIAQHA